ncbi:MAG: AraC family transcriptional regulator [Pseudonocardia sp.]|nr:AraC family transcriptional regulator [Pseudonocardia sp.]
MIGTTARPEFARHVLTTDAGIDVFREHLNALFYPAQVRPLSRSSAGLGELRGARTENLTVGLMRFGQDTSVVPEGTSAHYQVNVVLSGKVVAASGERQSVGTAGTAAVFTPEHGHRLLHCASGTEQVGVKIRRELVDDELEGLLGRPAPYPLEFDIAFGLNTPAGRSWYNTLRLLIGELDDDGLIDSPAMRLRYERLLVDGLLLGHRHNYTAELVDDQGAGPARPEPVRAVVDLIQARPEEHYTLADLARAAGVSARRLQECFQTYVGVPPMTYLVGVRLDRVHEDLRTGVASVTEAARHWGFAHLGRFSAAYRHRFGERPSDTLAARSDPAALAAGSKVSC